jgi:hypothetical protein
MTQDVADNGRQTGKKTSKRKVVEKTDDMKYVEYFYRP